MRKFVRADDSGPVERLRGQGAQALGLDVKRGLQVLEDDIEVDDRDVCPGLCQRSLGLAGQRERCCECAPAEHASAQECTSRRRRQDRLRSLLERTVRVEVGEREVLARKHGEVEFVRHE